MTPTTDTARLRDRDPRLFEVVSLLQRRLEDVGVRSALLHESPGRLDEHDLDLAFDGPWRAVWSGIDGAFRSLGYHPLLRSEYDVGRCWYAVFAKREGIDLRRVAVDLCGDVRGIGKFGVPIRRLLTDTVVRDGIRYPSSAWHSTYLIAKHAWKGIDASDALDAALRQARSAPRDFVAASRRVFGAKLARRIADGPVAGAPTSVPDLRQLLRAIRVRRTARSPLLPVRFARRWATRVARPTGLWIVVVGTDGSGKSTLAAELKRALTPYFRRGLQLHWSPGVLPRPGSLVGRDPRDPSRPHETPAHGRATSTAATLYHWLDHSLGYIVKIRPALVRSGIVVMERGFHDIVADPRRYRLDVPPSFVRALGRALPAPDLTIMLLGDPSVLHARKPELPPEEIERQQGRWKQLRGRLGEVAVVDAGRPLDEVIVATLDAVLDRGALVTDGESRGER